MGKSALDLANCTFATGFESSGLQPAGSVAKRDLIQRIAVRHGSLFDGKVVYSESLIIN